MGRSNAGGIAVKLYPCCYATHRPIAVALQAREALRAGGLTPEALEGAGVRASQVPQPLAFGEPLG